MTTTIQAETLWWSCDATLVLFSKKHFSCGGLCLPLCNGRWDRQYFVVVCQQRLFQDSMLVHHFKLQLEFVLVLHETLILTMVISLIIIIIECTSPEILKWWYHQIRMHNKIWNNEMFRGNPQSCPSLKIVVTVWRHSFKTVPYEN